MKFLTIVCMTYIAVCSTATCLLHADDVRSPIALPNGPHLLIDDFLIANSVGIERKVNPPQRFLTAPVVTSAAGHQNWQPFLTVLHDPATAPQKPFRMWYNADTIADPADGKWFGATAYLESTDGVRWPGPFQRLGSLTAAGSDRFGASVVGDGPAPQPPAERLKVMYFDSGTSPGPRVAFSPDGVQWSVYDGGRPVIHAPNGDDIWSAGFDPIRNRYFLIGKMIGPYSWTNAEGKKVTANVRRCGISFSSDFKTWTKLKPLFSPDERDAGVTQWYSAAGFVVRGDLIVGFLSELRDDLSPSEVPPAAVAANAGSKAERRISGGLVNGSGLGYTVLAWTRDGETWHRDRYTDKFFEPDPKAGAWDHAMSWIGSAAEVGDDLYLYYAGYRWGHKYQRSLDRQLSLVKMPRDRFVAREAGEQVGGITTPLLTMTAEAMTLNVDARLGEVRVQISDEQGKAIPGFSFDDCRPISTDGLNAPVVWKRSPVELKGRPVRLEFKLRNASLFAFELR